MNSYGAATLAAACLLFAVPCHGSAVQAPDCARATAEWTSQQSDAASRNLAPAARHKAALAFAKRYPDDPEGCIRPAILSEIAKLEAGLIHLAVVGREEAAAAAQRVMICNSIDPLSQHCSGPDLDDTGLSRQGEGVVRIGTGEKLRLSVDPSIGLKLTGVFVMPGGNAAGEKAAALQPLSGRTPFRVPHSEGVLIAVLRSRNRGGEFAYRKVLWRFAPR